MPSRRSAIAMNDDEVREFLDGERVLNVATIGPSGHPHVVAMWYAMIEGKPVFWTFGKSQKILNLRRDPKMTGLVEAGDSYNELRGVELVGTGRIVEEFEDVLRIGKIVAERYNGPAAVSEHALPFIENQARKRVGVFFEVERVVSWDHRKLGGTY